MGRTFENRKHAIAKRGARDAKAFTKAGRQISMAVKAGGPDPDANPALRRAVQNARAVSMPKDKILSAIEKASGANAGDDYQEILYEGYGPHGVAILVTTTTDNPTRTVANVRNHFKKGGGALGNAGSVAFLFEITSAASSSSRRPSIATSSSSSTPGSRASTKRSPRTRRRSGSSAAVATTSARCRRPSRSAS